jgi:hypothetical protein
MTTERARPAWFETARLLTMRVWLCAAHEDLILRSRAAASRRMAAQRTTTRVLLLAARCVRVFPSIHPRSRTEGAGKAGCPSHPWSACSKKARGRTTGTSRNARPSLRNGFNGFLRALPGETGLCCHRRIASSRKAGHLHRGARTTRLRRPRHVDRLTTRRVHRIPLPTFVTIAKRPSCGCGTRGSIVVICPTAQEEMCTTGNLHMACMHQCTRSTRIQDPFDAQNWK